MATNSHVQLHGLREDIPYRTAPLTRARTESDFRNMSSSATQQRMASAEVHALLDVFSKPQGLVSQLQPSASRSATSLRPASRDARSSSEPTQGPIDRSGSLARSLLSKSSLFLRRKNSKAGLTSFQAIEWDEEQNGCAGSKDVQELSKRRRSRHGRSTTANFESTLKKSISDPFDFQHLTHTSEQHAKVLQTATQRSQNELVSEFSAMRASQAARKELKGIKAEYITGGRSLSRQNSASHRISTQIVHRKAPSTPPSESELDVSPKSRDVTRFGPRRQGGLRTSQSVDNLSRMNHRSFSSPSPPKSPPPRRSSRNAFNLPLDAIGKSQSSPKPKPIVARDGITISHDDALHPSLESRVSLLAQHDPTSVGNAVSTPDNSAYTLRPQMSSSSIALANVPEEDEPGVATRQSAPGLCLTMASSLKHQRSSAMVNMAMNTVQNLNPKAEHIAEVPQPVVRDDSVSSTTAFQTRGTQTRSSTASQAATGFTTSFSDSWEDDIDYCYEHAAEADCAFDWDRVSCDNECSASASEQIIDEIIESAASSFHQVDNDLGYSSSPVTGSQLDLLSAADPQPYVYTYLDPSHIRAPSQIRSPLSATSSTVFTSEARTPSEATSSPNLARYARRYERESGIFPISPSLLTPHEYEPRVIEDSSYPSKPPRDGRETVNYTTDLPLYEPRFPINGFSGEESLRSSANPLSKCNSRDSLLKSIYPRSHDSLHGTTSSVGSLPELVHSGRTHGRDLSAELAKAGISTDPAETPSSTANMNVKKVPEATTTPTSSHGLTTEVQSVRRERSLSECPERMPSTSTTELSRLAKTSSSGSATPNPAGKSFAGRMRSASAATTLSGMSKKGRASYSLFPSVPVPGPR